MSPLITTIIISAILVVLAGLGLAIGLLLTGKSRLTRGSCGRVPSKRRDDSCGKDIVCPICEGDKKKEKEKSHDSDEPSE